MQLTSKEIARTIFAIGAKPLADSSLSSTAQPRASPSSEPSNSGVSYADLRGLMP